MFSVEGENKSELDTTDGDSAGFSLDCWVPGVTPRAQRTAVWVPAEVLFQIRIHSGIKLPAVRQKYSLMSGLTSGLLLIRTASNRIASNPEHSNHVPGELPSCIMDDRLVQYSYLRHHG